MLQLSNYLFYKKAIMRVKSLEQQQQKKSKQYKSEINIYHDKVIYVTRM